MTRVQTREFVREHRKITTPRIQVDALFRQGRVVGFRDLSRFPTLRERVEAVRIARETLRKPGADPESNECILARQLLRELKVD